MNELKTQWLKITILTAHVSLPWLKRLGSAGQHCFELWMHLAVAFGGTGAQSCSTWAPSGPAEGQQTPGRNSAHCDAEAQKCRWKPASSLKAQVQTHLPDHIQPVRATLLPDEAVTMQGQWQQWSPQQAKQTAMANVRGNCYRQGSTEKTASAKNGKSPKIRLSEYREGGPLQAGDEDHGWVPQAPWAMTKSLGLILKSMGSQGWVKARQKADLFSYFRRMLVATGKERIGEGKAGGGESSRSPSTVIRQETDRPSSFMGQPHTKSR